MTLTDFFGPLGLLGLFTSLPFDQLDQLSLKRRLGDIGNISLPNTETG